MGNALVEVGCSWVKCRTACGTTSLLLTLFRIAELRFLDSTTGRRSAPYVSYAFVNPKLKVHPRVMGVNTLRDCGASITPADDSLFLRDESRYPLMSRHDMLHWTIHNVPDTGSLVNERASYSRAERLQVKRAHEAGKAMHREESDLISRIARLSTGSSTALQPPADPDTDSSPLY